jgi:hypothetical protein
MSERELRGLAASGGLAIGPRAGVARRHIRVDRRGRPARRPRRRRGRPRESGRPFPFRRSRGRSRDSGDQQAHGRGSDPPARGRAARRRARPGRGASAGDGEFTPRRWRSFRIRCSRRAPRTSASSAVGRCVPSREPSRPGRPCRRSSSRATWGRRTSPTFASKKAWPSASRWPRDRQRPMRRSWRGRSACR